MTFNKENSLYDIDPFTIKIFSKVKLVKKAWKNDVAISKVLIIIDKRQHQQN